MISARIFCNDAFYHLIFNLSQNSYPLIYPGGAFRKSLIEFWLQHTVPDQSDELIERVKSHESPVDPYWDATDLNGRFGLVKAPSVMWGGWYDIFLVGNLVRTFLLSVNNLTTRT